MTAIETLPLARKLGAYMALSQAERTLISDLHQSCKPVAAGRRLVDQGQSNHLAYILSAGWACSYKILPNGARQIVDFHIPGDFLGLRHVLLHTSDHTIESITDSEVADVPVKELLEILSRNPRLVTAVLWAASRDEAMVVEHLVNIGRRSAVGRMAHFLLELGSRLKLVGLGDKQGYVCPLTQYHLADALGLTAVHVNRVLRQLRENGLLTFRHGVVTFDDYHALSTMADFDPTYLDQAGTTSIVTMRNRCPAQ
ncbi:Crp/Fnr family transcriptional regulator [Halomonas alkaliantarctica]|uniref:Crp/Fnr family transcriptional regulator n=1 Tax=Halomonas alkaliantarctica TaxID=232346 RepID=A0ABY8LIL9_9GAMM|nr:Crp/Fnr family transcriptional regulator [Halomonas alkaliantarctica]WGI24298.1 Crp/Fnr family transcriptional regulator [Halomonas alkaliantarctica]